MSHGEPQQPRTQLAFGPFVMDPSSRRLFRDGQAVPITARVFDTLEVLVTHRGRLVEKEVLLDRVWGDVAVEEGNLTRNVSTLRKVLGETPDDHRFVVTLPGRGYQFVAPVELLTPAAVSQPDVTTVAPDEESLDEAQPSAAGRRTWALAAVAAITLAVFGIWGVVRQVRTGATAPARIAVLPFKHLGAAGDDYVAAGLTEEITGRLAAIRDLRVISRTTAAGYERGGRTIGEIARDLDVDHVLEGSVAWDATRVPARLRITAQLIRASDDSHLWAGSFDRSTADLFQVQTDIATRVVRELRATIMADERSALEARPTESAEAYRAYLHGLFHAGRPDVSQEAMARTIAAFERAVELDPGFAAAHARLARAQTHYFRFGYDLSDGRLALARKSVERAETLAPDAPETHLASAAYLGVVAAPDRALVRLDAAERARPHDPLVAMTKASVLLRAARWDEGYASLRRALDIDPRNAAYLADAAMYGLALRRYSDAAHHVERSIDIEPDQLLAYVIQVWCAWLWKGDLQAARALLDRLPADDWRYAELRFLQGLHERRFDVALAGLRPVSGTWMRGALLVRPVVLLEAEVHRLQGERARADRAFTEAATLLAAEVEDSPEDPRLRSSLAIAYAGLGRVHAARAEASRALDLLRWPDAFEATVVREDVALAYTLIGDRDAALREIERLLTRPAHFSTQVLRLDPRWDTLRTHPIYLRLIGTESARQSS
jgi:DNA-binding winged helix-turn-helix (wHTH) protein/TolB-like protein/tetratricopeptide (TPR) repeat protein